MSTGNIKSAVSQEALAQQSTAPSRAARDPQHALAWQREMERAQLGTWLAGGAIQSRQALPLLPGGMAARAVQSAAMDPPTAPSSALGNELARHEPNGGSAQPRLRGRGGECASQDPGSASLPAPAQREREGRSAVRAVDAEPMRGPRGGDRTEERFDPPPPSGRQPEHVHVSHRPRLTETRPADAAHPRPDAREAPHEREAHDLAPLAAGLKAFGDVKVTSRFAPSPDAVDAAPLQASARVPTPATGSVAVAAGAPSTPAGAHAPLAASSVVPERLQAVWAHTISSSPFGAATQATAASSTQPLATAVSSNSGSPPSARQPAPPVRLHADWSADGVRLWLGLDAAALGQLAAIAEHVRRWMSAQGVRVLSLTCNGRPLTIEDRAAAPHPFDIETDMTSKESPWPSNP